MRADRFGVDRAFGIAMCRALDLDPSRVLSIDLKWRADEATVAVVRMLPTEGVVAEVLRLRVMRPT